jgi:predicted PurR-regulated permease PerM
MSFVRASRRSDIVFAFAVAVLLLICWKIRGTLLLVYLSIVFAVVFTPAVNWVQRLHVGRWHPSTGLAVLALIIFVVFVLAGFGFFVVPSVSADVQSFATDFPKHMNHLRDDVSKLPFGQHLAADINANTIESRISSILKPLLTSVMKITGLLTDMVLLIIMTAYFIVDGGRSFRWALSLISREERPRMERTLKQAATRMQQWLTGQGLLMLILGTSSFVVFWALGIRYFYALALFAALANFIPILGPIATVILVGGVAALDSWMKLLGVIVFYLVYQQVENSYLTPHIMRSTVELPAVSVIVALAVGGALAGIPGAMIAVPTAALIATIVREYLEDDREAGASHRSSSEEKQVA